MHLLPRALHQLDPERQRQRKGQKEKDWLYSCVRTAVTWWTRCTVAPESECLGVLPRPGICSCVLGGGAASNPGEIF